MSAAGPRPPGRAIAREIGQDGSRASGCSRLPVAPTGGSGGRPRPKALGVSSAMSSARRASTPDPLLGTRSRSDRLGRTNPSDPSCRMRPEPRHSGDVAGTTPEVDCSLNRRIRSILMPARHESHRGDSHELATLEQELPITHGSHAREQEFCPFAVARPILSPYHSAVPRWSNLRGALQSPARSRQARRRHLVESAASIMPNPLLSESPAELTLPGQSRKKPTARWDRGTIPEVFIVRRFALRW
jgi:hypothetical protein